MIFLFLLGLLSAVLYSVFVLPRKSGRKPLIKPTVSGILWDGMVIIPTSEYNAIHLHHWIFYIIIFVCCLVINRFYLLMGFSMGLFIQGLLYADSFTLRCSNPYTPHD